MVAMELLVVILNHTNEELNVEPQSASLSRGEWTDMPDLLPHQEILAGESGLLRCKSSHIGGGLEGSIAYQVIGFKPKNMVTFSWSVPYVGMNKFGFYCSATDFTVKILGGRGSQAVVVFVFEPALNADPRLEDGVSAVVTKYPLECVQAPVGGFTLD
ncbi:hypothetical protein NW762_012706 [Fusarium torreyae]|uniref:Uncharacterized protein n=1 Tax=Fusarium torreyae TaxID=1237075 RepID=A0A9W8RPV0_9HYPO|nr:hypothetical protein NW762_012706 [Fusarium torreyae]